MPITYLRTVPEDILHQLNGHYFGWIRNSSGGNDKRAAPVMPGSTWHKAIISIIPYDYTRLSSTSVNEKRKSVAIYLVQDDEEPIALDAQVDVQIMGFIRPPGQFADQRSTEMFDVDEIQAEASAVNDIEITQAFLNQPAWAPESSIKETESKNLSPAEKIKISYADARIALQRRVDQIPLHRAGIRSPADKFREEAVGIGGLYVRR